VILELSGVLEVQYKEIMMSSVMIQYFKGLSKELTHVLSDTRELDRVPNTK